jgi:thioredoxin-dependent peroxiredoxin
MAKIGDKAPNFRLKSDEDKEIALSDYKGQRVLIFLYPKANTSG